MRTEANQGNKVGRLSARRLGANVLQLCALALLLFVTWAGCSTPVVGRLSPNVARVAVGDNGLTIAADAAAVAPTDMVEVIWGWSAPVTLDLRASDSLDRPFSEWTAVTNLPMEMRVRLPRDASQKYFGGTATWGPNGNWTFNVIRVD